MSLKYEPASEPQALAKGEGVEYSVITKGTGPKPKVGDLVAIRFKVSPPSKVYEP